MSLRCYFGHVSGYTTVIDGKLYDCCVRCLEPYREVLPGQDYPVRQVQPLKAKSVGLRRDDAAIAAREQRMGDMKVRPFTQSSRRA